MSQFSCSAGTLEDLSRSPREKFVVIIYSYRGMIIVHYSEKCNFFQ